MLVQVNLTRNGPIKGTGQPKVYTPEQIQGIRKACQIGREVLDAAGRAVKVGVTTAEIDRVTYEATVSRGAYPSPLNYYNFPCAVCTSVNEVICHGIPDPRPFCGRRRGERRCKCILPGLPRRPQRDLCRGSVFPAGCWACGDGVPVSRGGRGFDPAGTMYRDIGSNIERVAKARGCQVVKTYCGHGIGELFHTAPNVPHYSKNKAVG